MNYLRNCLVLLLMLLPVVPSLSANTKETVEQVQGTVTLTADVDYIVTSTTPFADDAVVNIQNTDHAVLILQGVKPSKARTLLSAHVQINGQKAVNNTNCQLKLYNRGCIVLPYGNSVKPLTVYSEQNFEGTSCDDFGLESSGGFMNTLTDQKLNNRIRSFRLKRGYMVTFSLQKEGRGYSRCFIAADQDLEMATLPAILDRSISSYRVFKWYDTGKPQLAAAGGDNGACSALNVTSTYSWSQGSDMLPDVECVSHHIYEDWPSAASCGNVSYTCHMKTNNEPRNSSDDHPQTLETILDNWENLMRTGMRLCSPSSWDGSDYWNGTGFLKEFFDSIDARGWRCDIVDMHCYWPEANFSNLQNWVNAVRRPIWISEWCWGASWNNNGAFANGVTQNQVRDALRRICNNLNGMDYVERYFYWNGERGDISKIYLNGSLTPAGEMYAQLDGGVGYNGKYDYAPRAPKQRDPANLKIDFNRETGIVDVFWDEYNGEMNEYIHLEYRENSSSPWKIAFDYTTPDESPGLNGIVGIVEAQQGWQFRINEKDANGRERNSNVVTVVSSTIQAGDPVEVNGQTKYLGGNIIVNGDFLMDTQGWTNGAGEPIGQPWFQVVPIGPDGAYPYLQSYGHGGRNAEQSLKTVFAIEPGCNYYFQAEACNTNSVFNQLTLSADGTTADSTVASLINATLNWQAQYNIFNSGRFANAMLSCYNLGSKSKFANFHLCQLFDTPEEAYANAVDLERKRAQAVMTYAPYWTSWLQQQVAATTGNDQQDYLNLAKANQMAISCPKGVDMLMVRCEEAKTYISKFPLLGSERVDSICRVIENGLADATPHWVKDQNIALGRAFVDILPNQWCDDKISDPYLTTGEGWQLKAGTYKGGNQQLKFIEGMTCWSAWWNITPDGNEQQSMAIRQDVSGLEHGLYQLSCEAAADHFCITDQHAYISYGTDTASVFLDADWLDLPIEYGKWELLSTTPIYVDEGGTVTIGFESSKQGANDLAWREVGNINSKGDHHEGSWAATNFQLYFLPLYRLTVTPETYGVSCLPYAVAPSPNLTFYQIAAITADYKNICLEEIAEVEAGVPFIYKADQPTVCFLEHGEAVSKATDGAGNLRGYIRPSAATRVPLNYYVLNEGRWQKITDKDSRPRVGNFNGVIRPLNDKDSKPIAVVTAWDGPTMPIDGITDEEMATAINTISLSHPATDVVLYTLGGQHVNSQHPAPGIYIKVQNGKASTILIR